MSATLSPRGRSHSGPPSTTRQSGFGKDRCVQNVFLCSAEVFPGGVFFYPWHQLDLCRAIVFAVSSELQSLQSRFPSGAVETSLFRKRQVWSVQRHLSVSLLIEHVKYGTRTRRINRGRGVSRCVTSHFFPFTKCYVTSGRVAWVPLRYN
jgi:hypothetical protein